MLFRHPIVRRAVYDAARLGWRLGAHRRAGRELALRGAPIGVRAHHVERSGRAGDEEAIALLTDAGHAAAQRAPAAAARWLQAALRLLPASAAPHRRLALVGELATSLAATGRLQESRTVLSRALTSLPPELSAARAELTAMVARTEQGLGRGHEARRLLSAALAAHEPGSADAVALTLALAETTIMGGDWDGAVAIASGAREAARALGDDTLVLAATTTVAWAASYKGDTPLARRCIDEAARGFEAIADEQLTPRLVESLVDLAYAEATADNLTEGRRHQERGLRASRSMGLGYLFSRMMLSAAGTHLFQGRLDDALHACEAGVEASLLLDNDQLIATSESLHTWILTFRGELSAALASARAAVRATERAPDSLFAREIYLVHGEALVEAGEYELGRLQMLTGGGPRLEAIAPTYRVMWAPVLTIAEIETGRLADAEATTCAAEATAATLDHSARHGDARYARARVLLARDEPAAAAAAAADAAGHYDSIGFPIWAARARMVRGQALARTGDTRAAARELELAYAIMQTCGAIRLADRAAKELRGLGRHVARGAGRRTESRGPGMLSRREREVAEHIAEGRTNRQIGAELYLSEKTIEKHVGQVLRKLGVSSRAAVAATVERWRADRPSP